MASPTEPNQAAALRRLDQLESYLRQDPRNPHLLAECVQAAMAAAAWDRAEPHLRRALAMHPRDPQWLLREAHWLLGQRRWTEARSKLVSLVDAHPESTPLQEAITGDLAYIDLQLGDTAGGVSRLAPLAEADPLPTGWNEAMELVWLRLLHRAPELERAMGWLRLREAHAALAPSSAGVASLLALDAGDYAASLRWSTRSLQQEPAPVEARVARASLALGERDAPLALRLLHPALRHSPDDGRIWSALGFAHVLQSEFAAGLDAFRRAVALLPQHVGTWHGLGWTALAAGDLATARDAFLAALELDRNFAESHGGAAVVHIREGDLDRARASVAIALRLDEASLAGRYAEALLAGDARDADSLFRLAERMVLAHPSGRRKTVGDLLRTGKREIAGPGDGPTSP